MNTSFAVEVARYQEWSESQLSGSIEKWERDMANLQSILAAARKAQKNQKRAAKNRKKVVG